MSLYNYYIISYGGVVFSLTTTATNSETLIGLKMAEPYSHIALIGLK